MGHVTWPRPFQERFVIHRLGLAMFNPHMKCLRLPATKKCKAMPNVKILVLSHPLGDSGVMKRLHLWLDAKRTVNFLSVIIELFSLALMAAAQLSEICQNRRFLRGCVTFSTNFS